MAAGGAILIPAVDAESIIVTEPVLAVFGIAMAHIGLRGGRGAMPLGLTQIGVCLLVFGLINGLRWSPSDATVPLTFLSAIYALLALPATAWVASRLPPDRPDPNACRGCGYALFGLPTDACPECGLRFDPARVTRPPPSE